MSEDQWLSDNDRKEQLSLALARAVAAKAGYTTGQYDLDRESIDLLISARGNPIPTIGLQLKATSSPKWNDDKLAFVLPRKNYDDLRAVRLFPAFLVVMELPENEEDWLHWSDNEFVLRRCAWWLSLAGYPAIETETKTVYLPRVQFFNPTSLKQLMANTATGVR